MSVFVYPKKNTKDLIVVGSSLMGSLEPYLEGQGDLVRRLITPITHLVPLVMLLVNRFTTSP